MSAHRIGSAGGAGRASVAQSSRISASEAAVEAQLAARPNRAELVEAPREPGLPRRVTSRYRLPSIEHVANVLVAGTPPQLVAYYRALVAAGVRYFIVQCGQDPAALRLLAEQVVPHPTGRT